MFEDIIENNKKLEISKKKEYILRVAQNCTKRESNNKLIENLKRIVKKNKKYLIKNLNKDLLIV